MAPPSAHIRLVLVSGDWTASLFEGKREGRALVGFCLGPDPASVTLDDALRDGQADTGPLVLGRAVQSLKNSEELSDMLHVETGAVVFDEINQLGSGVVRRGRLSVGRQSGLRVGTNLDPRDLLPARVFESVGKQVRPNLLEQGRIPPALRQVADDDFHLSAMALSRHLFQAPVHDLARVEGLLGQRLAAELGESEQVVHQLSDLSRAVANLLDAGFSLRGQSSAVVVEQSASEAIDRP